MSKAKTKASVAREDLRVEYVALEEVLRWPKNPKQHDAGALASSFQRFGFVSPLILDEGSGRLVAGHGRLETLEAMRKANQSPPKRVRVVKGRWLVPVIRGVAFANEEEAMGYLLSDNRLVYLGGWDEAGLAAMLEELAAKGSEALLGTGFERDDLAALLARLAGGNGTAGEPQSPGAPEKHTVEEARRTLAERFGVPPFTVLDARQGYWQARKRAWLNLGIDSELGRTANLLSFSDTVLGRGQTPAMGGVPDNAEGVIPNFYEKLRSGMSRESIIQEWVARKARLMGDEGRAQEAEQSLAESLGNFTGTSVFDPVLCELVYRWFCPERGRVLDPFAGGSVRGIVAGRLGREYVGLDLRPEQLDANRRQAARILTDPAVLAPQWVEADARDLKKVVTGGFDLLFTCPPYFDLERYSEDKRDLSAAEDYEGFLNALGGICKQAVAALNDNSFAVLVLGEIRDRKTGYYRGLIPDAIGLMEEAGAAFYNEGVLVMSVSSLPIRVGKQFGSYRKLGRCHQTVLVFFKGDWKEIPESLADTEWGDLGLPQVEGDAEGFVAEERP